MMQLKKINRLIILILLSLTIAVGAPLADKKETIKRLANKNDIIGKDEKEFGRLVADVSGNLEFIFQEIDSEDEDKYVSFLILLTTLGTQGDERQEAYGEISERLAMLNDRKNHRALINAIGFLSTSANEAYLSKIQKYVNHENEKVKERALFSKKRLKKNIQKKKDQARVKAPDKKAGLGEVVENLPITKVKISTSEPSFTKKPAPAKKPAEPELGEPIPDNPFPYWIFIIGGVVVVGLVVVLRRK